MDWVTQTEYTELVKCFTDVDRVLPFYRRAFFRKLVPFLRTLRATHYDYVLDLQGLTKSAIVLLLARGKRKIGPRDAEVCARWLYPETAGAKEEERHAIDRIQRCVERLVVPSSPPQFPMQFPKRKSELPAPRIAIAPGSRWPTKNWPAASFAETARQLQAKTNASVFLLGSASDRSACSTIESALRSPVVNLAGSTSLVELGSVLQEMDLLVTNDSGPMHLAVALGTPVLAIFGPTAPGRTGPYGPPHRILTASLACQPCFRRKCRYGDTRCLLSVRPEDVTTAAVHMLR
ncbi:MAG: glycosyltransferase family 9 protein [Kiritimatiellae bacterium]|nr:glycosyltransferase family 9 protein [Kiritimatiellia bacterium]